jgi:hypothetical protein
LNDRVYVLDSNGYTFIVPVDEHESIIVIKLNPVLYALEYDRTEYHTIAHVKAGWLEKSKGYWSLTDEGRAAYEKHTDPGKFGIRV